MYFSTVYTILVLLATLYLLASVCEAESVTVEDSYTNSAANKLGKIYHEFAARIDALIGDEENQRRHEYETAKINIAEKASEIKQEFKQDMQNIQDKPKGVMETLKGWTGLASDKAAETKENVKDSAYDTKEQAKGMAASMGDKVGSAKDYVAGKAQDTKDYVAGKAQDAANAVTPSENSWLDDARDMRDRLKAQAAYYFTFGKAKTDRYTDAAKDKASASYEQAKETASGVKELAKEKAGETWDAAKQKAATMSERAEGFKNLAQEKYEELKLQAHEANDRAKLNQ